MLENTFILITVVYRYLPARAKNGIVVAVCIFELTIKAVNVKTNYNRLVLYNRLNSKVTHWRTSIRRFHIFS